MYFYGKLRTSEKFASYLRLSIEDGDKAESNSISNQRELIKSYAENHPEIHIVQEFVDDGYTGINFERPGFQSMIEAIEAGKINGIIVKDLSRLGRDYIGMGKYIEKIFPTIGVRFISINDNYDNAQESNPGDSFIIPFKNLMNDSYCRDISMKIRSQQEIKRKKGELLGGFAPFGYMKDENDKNHLVIDEYAAAIVRDIFEWILDGKSANMIANELNEKGIPSPAEYKRINGLNFNGGFKTKGIGKWGAGQVFRILENEVYLGHMIQGKSTNPNYKVKTRIAIPKEQWVRVENTHEPIISQYTYDLVHEVLKMDIRHANSEWEDGTFTGVVKCGGCGENMIRRSVKKRGLTFVYRTCSTTLKDHTACTSHLINEKKLEAVLLANLKEKISMVTDLEKKLVNAEKRPRSARENKKLAEQYGHLEEEISRYMLLREQLFKDLQEETITKEEYEEFKDNFDNKIKIAKSAQDEVKRQQNKLKSLESEEIEWIERLKQYKKIDKLTRRILVELVESIIVYDKSHIKINYRFAPLLEIAAAAEEKDFAPDEIFDVAENEIRRAVGE